MDCLPSSVEKSMCSIKPKRGVTGIGMVKFAILYFCELQMTAL